MQGRQPARRAEIGKQDGPPEPQCGNSRKESGGRFSGAIEIIRSQSGKALTAWVTTCASSDRAVVATARGNRASSGKQFTRHVQSRSLAALVRSATLNVTLSLNHDVSSKKIFAAG